MDGPAPQHARNPWSAVLAWAVAAVATVAAMSAGAGASVIGAGMSLAAVYAFGYVAGALFVGPGPLRSTSAIIRTVTGLLAATVAFLLSLRLSLPWFVGPALLVAAALGTRRSWALVLPAMPRRFMWNAAWTTTASAVLLAPIAISSLRMAPGEFPPVFFNVDTPYFLEKVHALTTSDIYPPPSLSFSGGRLAYHFGSQGLAALISRASGLPPHHSLFLIVLPLLTLGVVAAATLLARTISPHVPALLSVPLLLVAVPTDPLWDSIGRRLLNAWSSWSLGPLRSLLDELELWGVTANNGQNVAAHFLVLTSLASVATAPVRGWRLPVVLIGTAIIFKSTAGLALVGGFCAAQAVRALQERRALVVAPALAAAAVFGLTYWAFWVLPLPADYRTEPYPFLLVEYLAERGGLPGAALDLFLLCLPALMLVPIPRNDLQPSTLPLLAFALAPLVIVNLTRVVAIRPLAGVDDNWMQVVLPVPLLLHAFGLAVAEREWTRIGTARRFAFAGAVALMVMPALIVAVRYSRTLIANPTQGHEFVDNTSLAQALRAVPLADTVIVTNDLRYPAEGFRRDNRQMQIPALFGHQAFGVNYYYESYPFSPERLALQQLLSAAAWTDDITRAARAHRWTHFLVRKDYIHPSPVPLTLVFENTTYAVYRFPDTD